MKKFIILALSLLMAAMPVLAEFSPPPVAEFTGGSIDYDLAYAEFIDTLSSYADFGWGEAAADQEAIAQQVLEQLVERAVLYNKALELGLTEVPEDQLNGLRETAQQNFDEQVSYYMDFYASPDMDDAEARALTIEVLAEDGITADALLQQMLDDWWYSALYDYVCADVAIDETHIWAYAESLATTQALEWAEDQTNFDTLYMNDDLIAWYPEGARYIKHILVGFDAEQAQAYQDLIGDGTMADADPAALDAIYAPLNDRVAEVQNALMNGEDFGELMRTYGSDDFMLYEPYSIEGYIVQPGCELFVTEFVDACFALENIGDISAPVRTAGGVHFILYAGDVPAGPVALENIVDAVAAEAQDQLISDTFDAQVAAWVKEAQPVYHPEYLLQ